MKKQIYISFYVYKKVNEIIQNFYGKKKYSIPKIMINNKEFYISKNFNNGLFIFMSNNLFASL